jgi:AcrR family transcriptional regulator
MPPLLELADGRRDALQLLANESLVAGARAMDARDALIGQMEERVKRLWSRAQDPSAVPDVPMKALVGGTIRLLANRVRQGDNHLPDLLPGLLGWLGSYLHDAQETRWTTLAPAKRRRSQNGAIRRAAASERLAPLPRGRHKLPEGYVRRNRRERILNATGELALDKGYTSTSVADIVSVAGVSRDVFYDNFHDKQEAFVAAYELGFRETLAASANAFFGGGDSWPERVWAAAKAFTQFFDDEPGLAQIGYVEAYALGPAVAKRVTDTQIAFTMFLEEGYRYRSEAEGLPRLCSEAIAASIFELAYHHQRSNPEEGMSGLLGDMAYVTLAPFMGPDPAAKLIAEKLSKEDGAPGAGAKATAKKAPRSPAPAKAAKRAKSG